MEVEDEFGEFPGGCAVAEAVEVGVFLKGDEAVLVDMAKGTLQALFEGVRRGRGGVGGCALEGVLLVDVSHQFLINLEIHALDPHMMVFLLGRRLLRSLWIRAICLVISKFQLQREYAQVVDFHGVS